jgi:replicative DNA helicase
MAEQGSSGNSGEGSIAHVKEAVERFERLAAYNGNDRIVTWRQWLQDKDKNTSRTVSFSSGFTELDFITDGFQSGELITISGYTGMGKTLFLKSLIRSFGIENVPTCIFSYEDSPDRYLKLFLEESAAYPIFLPLELKTGDLDWLEGRIVEAKVKHGVRVVTIDHLHYLLDIGGASDNVSWKMGSIMRFLKKRIAEEYNLVVFVIAHQGKAKDDQQEASLETIRDSGLIANESDKVIIVQRIADEDTRRVKEATYEKNYSVVKVEKDRRTGAYRKRLTFQKQNAWLTPL